MIKLLCAGVGQLNQRVAKRWQSLCGEVHGFRQSSPDASLGFPQTQIDLSASRWPDVQADVVVVAVSANQRTLEQYRRTYVDTVNQLALSLDHWDKRPSKVLVISSTRVYGEDSAQQLDDESIAQTDDVYGQCLLEMESIVHQLPVPSSVLRLSGLYGPGKDWLLRQALKPENDLLLEDKWTNRIHVDDAAAAVVFLAQQSSIEASYIVSDTQPTLKSDMFQYFRKSAGAPALRVEAKSVTGKQLMPSRLTQLQFKWQYPNAFSGGYDWLFDTANPDSC